MSIKISIISATYNAEKTIEQSISSILKQNYCNKELIVIDGASKDATNSIIKSIIGVNDKHISEPDNGIYDALNKGIKHSTGDVIGFLHSDDFYVNDTVLGKIAEAFLNPDVMLVYGDLEYVDSKNTSNIIRTWKSNQFTPKSLYFGWMPPHPTLYVRSSVYKECGVFDANMKISADYENILRLFKRYGNKSCYIPEVMIKMRTGGASNKSIKNIFLKSQEDYRAIKRNNVGGILTLIAKNLRKIPQFIICANRRSQK